MCIYTQIYLCTNIHKILESLEHIFLIFMGSDLDYINKSHLHKIRKTGEEEKPLFLSSSGR